MGVDATICCSLFASHNGGSSSTNVEDDKPAEFSSASLDLVKSNASSLMEVDIPETSPASPSSSTSMASPPSKHIKRGILKDVPSAANCPLSMLETPVRGSPHIVKVHEGGSNKNLQSVKCPPLPRPETPSHITRIATALTVEKARRDEEVSRKRKADMVESIRAEIGGEGNSAKSPSVVKAVKVYREMVRAQDSEAHTPRIDSKMVSIKAEIQPEKEGSSPSVSKLVQTLSARKIHQQTSSREYQIDKARSIAAEIEAARQLSAEIEESNSAAVEEQRIQEERAAAEEQRIQEERAAAAEEQRIEEERAAVEEQRIQEERAAAEGQHKREEAAAAEEQRIQEERAAAEEQRKREEAAAAEEQRKREEATAAEEQCKREEAAAAEEQCKREEAAAAEEQRIQEEGAAAEEQRIQEEGAAAEEQRIQEERAAAEEQCIQEERAAAEEQCIREERAASMKQRYEEENSVLSATNVQQSEEELRRMRKDAESKRLLEHKAFKETLTKGVTLLKHSRNGKSMQRTLKWKLGNDELGFVGWGSGWHSLSACTEVRRGTDLDPLTDGKRGTATLNACKEGQRNPGLSFSLIFPDRTLDFSADSKEQCKQLVYQFRSLLRSIS